MTADVIEGEAVQIPERALVVSQPGQVIVTDTAGPTDMLERASAIATALAAMVEKQKLYTTIRGKKYPQVEAWQTIGRMDNVVAREASRPIQHEDGSWEAEVELVRLSDGMVIGNGSALCGVPGERHSATPPNHDRCDGPWCGRAAHQKRSMAVTRATSRAFRQHYSWIMALAGYEPTPADEMPDESGHTHEPPPDGSLIGTVAKGKSPVDYELRQTPDGPACGFTLVEGRQKIQVLAVGPLADALVTWLPGLTGVRVKVWGRVVMIAWQKDGRDMPPYRRVLMDRIETPDFILPAVEAPSVEMFQLDPEERAQIAGPYA